MTITVIYNFVYLTIQCKKKKKKLQNLVGLGKHIYEIKTRKIFSIPFSEIDDASSF